MRNGDIYCSQLNGGCIAEKINKVVDTIVRKDGVRYYKISWVDTWESEECLVECEKIIKEFWENYKQKSDCEKKSLHQEFKPILSSGRRKSRPKKLVTYLPTSIENTSEKQVNTPKLNTNNKLVLDIPVVECDNSNVEKYPVMIIKESGIQPLTANQVNGEKADSPQSYDSAQLLCSSEPAGKKLISSNRDVIYFKPKDHCLLTPVPHDHVNSSQLPKNKTAIIENHELVSTKTYPDTLSVKKSAFDQTKVNKFENDSNSKVASKQLHASQLLLKLSTSAQTTHQSQNAIYKVSNGDWKKKESLHVITENGEQRPQCAECFQTFKKRAALERHMMIHRGIKPFQCHYCNQRFRQKHHLQGHIMLHTGERPHSCSLCDKRFRMRHHLLEHERISHKVFR